LEQITKWAYARTSVHSENYRWTSIICLGRSSSHEQALKLMNSRSSYYNKTYIWHNNCILFEPKDVMKLQFKWSIIKNTVFTTDLSLFGTSWMHFKYLHFFKNHRSLILISLVNKLSIILNCSEFNGCIYI